MSNTIIFEMITTSIMSRYDFENSQISTQETLLASRVMISLPQKNRLFWCCRFWLTEGYEMMHKAWGTIADIPFFSSTSSVKFQGHTGPKNADFDLNLALPERNTSLNSQMAPKMMRKAWSRLWELSYCFSMSSFKFQSPTGQRKSPIFLCFRFIIPVLIDWWLRNDAQSLK